MTSPVARIAENLRRVRERIAEAAARGGRSEQDILLVAVTKYAGELAARAAVDAGCRHLGESRPQELWQKAGQLGIDDVHWHLVGHLQRNKVARTLPLVRLIHSVDSLRLVHSIESEAKRADLHVPVLLEVNVSRDEAKHGFAPDELAGLAEPLSQCTHLEVRGLMAMAGRLGGLDQARRDFAALRGLRDELQSAWPESLSLAELSMGMSNDFEAAIEEGATIIRLGSVLFEGVS